MIEKKPNCPKCDSKNVAWILWGLPADMESLEKELEQGKIVLGGCLVSNNDPEWECNECHHRWGQRDDADSFDYDQGFNLDEVYD